ncbi:D-hexose-6-phosphate mutarotase [Chitinivorax sp. B]|uniref:D-hexose-6-phosphate mutarotase n=1 Tax=Chitinivorax sp. B TaxID=2502235 RepID=UPI0010F6528D|nr:D-hexose-6-phosphate mutarotase [Chitinivorax sp. B]
MNTRLSPDILRDHLAPSAGPLLSFQHDDGSSIALSLFGGQLCHWRTADGSDPLYLSPHSMWNGYTAIRGGMPVIFPQFANEGLLPKHGVARTSLWQLAEHGLTPSGHSQVKLVLGDTASTRCIWPYSFELMLTFTFGGNQLTAELEVHNTGSEAFDFTGALHTYLATPVVQSSVAGLSGLTFLDSADQRRLAVANEGPLHIDREIDRFFFNVPHPVTLTSPGRRTEVEQSGFTDVVVWNPWQMLAANLPDLPDTGYLHFVCIESAVVGVPTTVAPGHRWTGTQRLVAHSASTH